MYFWCSWQAWHVLSNLQVSCRHYDKPGKTRQVKDVIADGPDAGRTTTNSLSDVNAGSQYMKIQKNFSEFSVDTTKPSTFTSNLSASLSNVKAMGGQNGVDGNNMARPMMVNHSHSQRLDGSVNFSTNQRNNCSSFLEDEDDDILEVILVNNYYSLFV